MKSELYLSLNPVPLQPHLNIVTNETFEQFRVLNSFTDQLKFYNKNICSLAARNMAGDLAIYSESDQCFVIYSGMPAYRNKPGFSPENEKEFFRIREQEVNRIIRLLKKLNSYEEKVIALTGVRGFELYNLKVFANLPYEGEPNPDKQFLSVDPVINLEPMTPDEILGYNRIIEQRVCAFNFVNNSSKGQFNTFDFISKKAWFESAKRPLLYVEKLILQIESYFGYPRVEIPNDTKIQMLEQVEREVGFVFNLFERLVNGNDVDFGAFQFSEHGYREYIHTSEIVKFYNYLEEIKTSGGRIEPLTNQSVSDSNKSESKLSIKEIALIHYYRRVQITRENASQIAAAHGYIAKTSGEGLFQDYTFFTNSDNRKGRPNQCTAKKLKNKIKLLESVVAQLDTAAAARAQDELKF